MANKIISFDEHFATGEPTVQLVSVGRGGRTLREATSLHKTAEGKDSPALEYIKNVEPEEGKTIVLVIGLGDHETYGANRNGDGFPSEPVPGKIASDEVLTKHYQSYDNAHVFEHHVNHDPKKAIGRVKKAFWNPRMRRVEVLEDFDHKKAPHLLEKIGSGEYLAKSMGCRIKHDTCTICGNNAPTRKDYCEHLKYSMGKVLPDGRKVAALNPSPRFFDSSWVFRPADRTGFMLKKVAKDSAYELWTPSYELAERVEDLRGKAAAFGKASAIEKVISGDPVASSSGLPDGTLSLAKKYSDTAPEKNSPKASGNQIKVMIEYSPSEALGTADACGMPLGLKDLIQFFMGRLGGGQAAEPELEAASKQAAAVFELFERYPRFYEEVLKTAGLDGDLRVSEKLAQELIPQQIPDMRLRDTPLHQHQGISMLAPQGQRPNTDTLSYTGPQGQAYTTNLGRARETAEALEGSAQTSKALRGAGYLGMGTLMGAAGLGKMMLGKRTPLNRFAGGALAGLGAASGLKGLHEGLRDVRMSDLPGPKVLTNEGVPISAYTEMVPMKTATVAPEMAYVLARRIDGACVTPLQTRKLAVCVDATEAEITDRESPVLGPTLHLAKTALLLETHILSCL